MYMFQTVTVMHEEPADMGSVTVQVWRNPAVARPSPEGTVVHEETFSKTLWVTPSGLQLGECCM